MRRRLSQLGLAGEADISARHLSFVETGRARPSRGMLLRLADELDMPPRTRNELLRAGGFADLHPRRSLDEPALAPARVAIEIVLRAHEPFPAVAVDRTWTLVAGNDAVGALLAGLPPAMLVPPVNVLRLSLHPEGLAPRILNLGQWRAHLLSRLRRDIERTGDPALQALLAELHALPFRASAAPADDLGGLAVPLRLRVPGFDRPLCLLSTTTVFGTAVDETVAELTLECFLPADEDTRRMLTAR